MNNVLVFKTSVTTPGQAKQVKPVLNHLLAKSEKWNFDLEDCDHILRVEAISIRPEAIIHHLQQVGFHCEELAD